MTENNTETEKIERKLIETDEEITKKANIWQRIWAVQSEVKPLIKDELNKFQNYKYFEEEQVLKVLNPLLKKYRLGVILSENVNVPVVYEEKEKQINIKYQKRLELINIDKPDEKLEYFYNVGGNNQDLAKVKGSAETYATKYILSKFFLIRVIDENEPEKQVIKK